MARPTVEPIETKIDNERTRITHPAFGQIGASRVSGHANLYGSDFQHQHYVSITLRKSEVDRHLSNDWHHGTDELFEVSLSEAQWATFVSSMNVGMGVPCTIQHTGRGGMQIPHLPDPPDRRERFAQEMAAKASDAVAELDELAQLITESKLSSKASIALLKQVGYAKSKIIGGTQFVAKQFDEHMEGTVEKAKIEVNAYATRLMMSTGLDRLGLDAPITLGIAHQEGDM